MLFKQEKDRFGYEKKIAQRITPIFSHSPMHNQNNMAAGWEEGPEQEITDFPAEYDSGHGRDLSPMDVESPLDSEMKPSSSLQLMLTSIAQERGKDFTSHKLISDGEFQFYIF